MIPLHDTNQLFLDYRSDEIPAKIYIVQEQGTWIVP